MCGIAGYLGDKVDGLLDRMIEGIAHRGPDAVGQLELPGAYFGHTRLSIIDLEHGQQPMVRANGRLTVVYNGEIYNYDELRQDIEARDGVFDTHCDTELLPLGYQVFGSEFFSRLNGMFAFALYDAAEGTLFLARDHFGIKPLYYALTGNGLVFSSCARSVAMHPEVSKRLRPDAVRQFLQYRYVPSGTHFFDGVETLAPGHMAVWRNGHLKLERYWKPPLRGERNGGHRTPSDWVEETEALLADAVRLQMRSDVPVGIFLSGGVDSSLVAHLASKCSTQPLMAYTYSIGDEVDEVERAARLARHYDIGHQIVARNGSDQFSCFYHAVACMDLPVGDAIIVPTYELCSETAKDRKVVLTGEGGDEVFGGYMHFPVLRQAGRMGSMGPILKYFAPLLSLAPLSLLDRFFDYQASLGVLGRRKLQKMVYNLGSSGALYRLATSVIDDADIVAATHLPPPDTPPDMRLALPELMLEAVQTWLPNQILNKMDQLSMAHGLEARVPFLDPRLYELLAEAPDSLFLNGSENKVLLRRVLKSLDIATWNQQKIAFHLPMEQRYRQDLLALCNEWLSREQIRRHGILREEFVDENIELLKRGEFIASKRLVTMASLHIWIDAHGGAL